MTPNLPAIRTESDRFGAIELAQTALWGAQTERSLRLFAIGRQRMPAEIVHAIAEIKRAAAQVNGDLGLLAPEKAQAIATAAARVAAGEFDAQFPLSVWQTGSGTQSDMNANEVIANLASVAPGGAMGCFAAHCVRGITADAQRCAALLNRSRMRVTARVPHIGHDRAAAIAARAQGAGLSLREAALSAGGVAAADFDAWVDPSRMLGPA